MGLERVFSPISIGRVVIPNRIVRTAHDTGFAGLEISDQFIAYHLERAKGGCGLSILEAAAVHPSTKLDLALFGDKIVEGYQKLTAAIRPHGMKLFQQLWHGGGLYPSYQGPPLSVSTVASYVGTIGRPMTEDEIFEVIGAFARSARRVQEGGLDGVEVHAGHGYLFHHRYNGDVYAEQRSRHQHHVHGDDRIGGPGPRGKCVGKPVYLDLYHRRDPGQHRTHSDFHDPCRWRQQCVP